MGCSGCTKNEDGDSCESRKAPQRVALDDVIGTLYPTRTWGRPDDEARFGTGVRPGEVTRLAQALSTVTKAPTFVRPGGDEDLCNYIYILCVGRVPCLLDVRDERAPVEFGEGEDRVRERYLRVALSSATRMATVQEVSFELDRLDGNSVEIRELPRPGVYDKILLKRMRGVVDLLLASDLLHVDFGLIDKPLEGADESIYEERFASRPHLVNYLFFAAPVNTSSVTIL